MQQRTPHLHIVHASSIFERNANQATENLWWAFNSPLGQQYSTDRPGTCCRVAKVASRGVAYTGPLGTFDSALQMSCLGVFQVGIIQETFLRGVGLALRSQATGGPSYGSWELIYARVGGARRFRARTELRHRAGQLRLHREHAASGELHVFELLCIGLLSGSCHLVGLL